MRNALTCIVADDEAPIAARVARLAETEGLRVLASCASGEAALDAIARFAPQIAFLDIRMPGLTGLDVLERLRTVPDPPACVLVTAFDEHAVAASSLSAVDYVLKPVARARFADAVERARATLRASDALAQIERFGDALRRQRDGTRPERITVRDGGRILQFDPACIERIEAADDYAALHVHGADNVEGHAKEYLIPARLGALERALPAPPFLRVHRTHLVNIDHVSRADPTGDGRLILTVGGTPVPCSRAHAERLRDTLLKRTDQRA